MYIQDKLKEYRDKLENEFLAHSMFSKDQLFINPRTLSAGNKTRLKNQIQSTYLLWLMVIVEAMERRPRFEFANTIESFMKLKYHNVSVSEMESMINDCFQRKGIFTCKNGEYNIGSTESCKMDNSILFSSGKLIGFDYYDDASYTSADGEFWSLGNIAEIIIMLCGNYNTLPGKIRSSEALPHKPIVTNKKTTIMPNVSRIIAAEGNTSSSKDELIMLVSAPYLRQLAPAIIDRFYHQHQTLFIKSIRNNPNHAGEYDLDTLNRAFAEAYIVTARQKRNGQSRYLRTVYNVNNTALYLNGDWYAVSHKNPNVTPSWVSINDLIRVLNKCFDANFIYIESDNEHQLWGPSGTL